ncbi:DUF4393 domain-containing protein [Arthrobacter sp. C152]
MTGAEVAGAAMVGKVVEHVGKEAAEERKAVNRELREGAKDSPYMADASDNYAKRVAIRQAIMTQMYLPIAKLFGVANRYFEPEGQFAQDMGQKLKDVPEEHLVAPKASMAAPAMQQLGFSLDEPNLKEMYLNLLATASDDRRNEQAHPSFVEVIKQLSSKEATFLRYILPEDYPQAIVSFHRVTNGQEGSSTLQKHVMQVIDEDTRQPAENPELATFVDNWIRLGLVEVDYSKHLTAGEAYDWAMKRPEANRLAVLLNEDQTLGFDKGYIRPTNFGRRFAKVVGLVES